MALTYKIWDFPNIAIQKQLFHVPGMVVEGGFTSGGARTISPEPGGRAVLEMQVALQVQEWDSPISSWLMSKINGDIFRVRLVNTPQLIDISNFSSPSFSLNWGNEGKFSESTWDNDSGWDSEFALAYSESAKVGQTNFVCNMVSKDLKVKKGNVIGLGDSCYIIDDIELNNSSAVFHIKPPLRNNIRDGDIVFFRPYFTGTISNGAEMRQMYESANVGHIQLNRMIFQEVVI